MKQIRLKRINVNLKIGLRNQINQLCFTAAQVDIFESPCLRSNDFQYLKDSIISACLSSKIETMKSLSVQNENII